MTRTRLLREIRRMGLEEAREGRRRSRRPAREEAAGFARAHGPPPSKLAPADGDTDAGSG